MASTTAPVGIAETTIFQRIFGNPPQSTYWDSLSATSREACVNRNEFRRIGDCTAYDVAGVIELKWNDEVYPAVKKLLNDRLLWIYKNEKLRIPFKYAIYMVGKQWDSTRPTIITTCKSLDIAERITNLLRKKLGNYRLGFDYFANATPLTAPAETSTSHLLPKSNTSDPHDSEVGTIKGQGSKAEVAFCGVPIHLCKKRGADDRWATVGGCLWVDGICHLLTVCHVMLDDSSQPEDIETSPAKASRDDESDIGSNSSVEGDRVECSFISTVDDLRTSILISPWEISVADTKDPYSLQYLLEISPEPVPVDPGMDWAMFTLEGYHWDHPMISNHFTLPDGSKSVVQGTSEHGPEGKALVVVNGRGEEVRASSTKVGIFLPHAAEVIDAWPMNYRSRRGQCGSWVLSPDGNLVYGTLALYAEAYGQSYIIPMTQTIEAIRSGNPGENIQLAPQQSAQITNTKIYYPEEQNVGQKSKGLRAYDLAMHMGDLPSSSNAAPASRQPNRFVGSFTIPSCGNSTLGGVHQFGTKTVDFSESVLYDTGTMYNWIAVEVVERLGLRWDEDYAFSEVADFGGVRQWCSGKVAGYWSPEEGGQLVPIDLYITRHVPCRIIFGSQFLSAQSLVTFSWGTDAAKDAWFGGQRQGKATTRGWEQPQLAYQQAGYQEHRSQDLADSYRGWYEQMRTRGWRWDISIQEFYDVDDKGNRMVPPEWPFSLRFRSHG